MIRITKDVVREAYERGVIKLDVDPDFGTSTVARIGDDWFYFNDIPADDMKPEEYKNNVPEERIVTCIFNTLDEFNFEDADKYAYYEILLDDALSRQEEVH